MSQESNIIQPVAVSPPRLLSPRPAAAAILFLLLGGLIGATAYLAPVPDTTRMVLKFSLPLVCLAGWLAARRWQQIDHFEPMLSGFFAVSSGLLLAHYIGHLPRQLLGYSISTIEGVALAKLGEAIPIVVAILLVHRATGGKSEGLYLGAGRKRLGLIFAAVGSLAFLGVGALQAIGSGLAWSTIRAALPWILIFIFSNAFMEELWFRGLFLKKMGPLVGSTAALILTSLVFSAVHISATYVIDIAIFLVATTALGLLWGWMIRKTDSLWPSVIIHASGDVLVMLGFLIQISS